VSEVQGEGNVTANNDLIEVEGESYITVYSDLCLRYRVVEILLCSVTCF